ncbi:TPA: hypothetical protein DCX16_01740 [bacterium]|nr:hypothetical protein [bacterium]
MGGYFIGRKKGKGAWKMKVIFVFIFFAVLSLASEPKEEDMLFQEGLYHYKNGRYDLAIKLFSKVIEKDPLYPKIEEMYISSLKKRAESLKVEEKEEKIKKEVEVKKEEPKPEPPIPLRYEAFKDEPEIEEPEVKVTILPEEEDYLFARKLIFLGLIDDGMKILDDLLKKKNPISDKILFTQSKAYFEKKEYDRTVDILNKLNKEYPNSPLRYEVELLLCDCIFQKKDYKDALIGYMKVTKEIKGTMTDLFPTIPPNPRENDELLAEVQLMIGNCYKELGDYQSSIVEYKKVLDEYSKEEAADDACFYIADLYDKVIEARDFYEAVKFYGKLIMEYPNSMWIERAKMRKKHIEENYL